MDEFMANMANWEGELEMMFGSNLFVCMSGNFEEGNYFDSKMNELLKQMQWLGIEPSKSKFHFFIFIFFPGIKTIWGPAVQHTLLICDISSKAELPIKLKK